MATELSKNITTKEFKLVVKEKVESNSSVVSNSGSTIIGTTSKGYLIEQKKMVLPILIAF